MTQPVQENTDQRAIGGLDWRTRQLARRPGPNLCPCCFDCQATSSASYSDEETGILVPTATVVEIEYQFTNVDDGCDDMFTFGGTTGDFAGPCYEGDDCPILWIVGFVRWAGFIGPWILSVDAIPTEYTQLMENASIANGAVNAEFGNSQLVSAAGLPCAEMYVYQESGSTQEIKTADLTMTVLHECVTCPIEG